MCWLAVSFLKIKQLGNITKKSNLSVTELNESRPLTHTLSSNTGLTWTVVCWGQKEKRVKKTFLARQEANPQGNAEDCTMSTDESIKAVSLEDVAQEWPHSFLDDSVLIKQPSAAIIFQCKLSCEGKNAPSSWQLTKICSLTQKSCFSILNSEPNVLVYSSVFHEFVNSPVPSLKADLTFATLRWANSWWFF